MAFLQEYTLLQVLGEGGFAKVFKARHNELGYIRAVRVLNETIVDSSSKTYQKFLRECKMLLRLGNGNHPNIVHIYQPRLLDNKALVEMDYVDGLDLMRYLERNQNFTPVDEVIRMATQISSALAYCHEDIYRFCMDRDLDNLQDDEKDGTKVIIDEETRKCLIDKYKVIHNDIHSGNIMRREDGNFVLLDFGLAINGDEVVRSSRHTNGAPEFKAPEKWNDESILTEQSDIYSFGVVMYQFLAGQVPFQYDAKLSKYVAEYKLGEAHHKSPVPPIENLRKEFFEKKYDGKAYERDYPQWLEDVIMRCLSKNPADRFKNGKELYEHIMAQSKNSNNNSNDAEIKKLKFENKTLVLKVDNLRNINTDLNTKLTDSINQVEKLNDEIRSLEKEIDSLKRKKAVPVFLYVMLMVFILYGAVVSAIVYSNHNYLRYDVFESVMRIGSSSSYDPFEENFDAEKDKQIEKLNATVSELQKEVKDLKKIKTSTDDSLKILNMQLKQNQEQLEQNQDRIDKLNKDLKEKKSLLDYLLKKMSK